MKSNIIIAVLILSTVLFIACAKNQVEKPYNAAQLVAFDYSITNAPAMVKSNFGEINTKAAQVGRALFYDKMLSINNNISCGSCHIQSMGFSDNFAVSPGFNNQKTLFNSMPLVNLGAQNHFFWDGRSTNISKQVMMPIANHIEMGLENTNLLMAKLSASTMYVNLFSNAFADGKISSNNVAFALSNFVNSIVSYNTKYDKYLRNEALFSEIEMKGLELFTKKYNCQSCHGGENFNSQWGGITFANIGLSDKVDLSLASEGFYKTPNLRNVALTAPYMHDGSLRTLENVIDHYNFGVKGNEILDWRLEKGGLKIITSHEKKALIAFLNTLTDSEMRDNPKWSNPF